MSSGYIPDITSDYIPDVTFTGAFDTGLGDYSGSSTLQDTIVGSPGLELDNSFGATTGSVFDLSDFNDPYLSQSLSGVTDPPIGSMFSSSPTPNSPPPTAAISNGLSALAKFGSGIAALIGGSSGVTRQVSSVNPQLAVPRPAAGTPMSGETTIILVIVVVAMIALLAHGGE